MSITRSPGFTTPPTVFTATSTTVPATGARITRRSWLSATPLRRSVSAMPEEMTYHQRRNAFRAALKLSQLVDVTLDGTHIKGNGALRGKLLDISATGCRLRFQGDLGSRLQAGQVYERMSVKLPFGTISTAAELRHLSYEDKLDITYVGMRFYRMDGLAQRSIERFVYQVQREARQLD